MQASESSAVCCACQHDIGAGSSLKPSKAKALDCTHSLCSNCFNTRIRILHHDKIMVLKCPVPTCKAVTTKALPAKYCASARKFNPRRNMGSAFKTRSQPSSHEKKKKENTGALLGQFNDIPVGFVHPSHPVQAKSVMYNDVEWCIYALKVACSVVLLAIVTGGITGFESLFSNPQAHLDTTYSSIVLPVLVFALLAAEFVPQSAFVGHEGSLQSVQVVDVLLVVVLCVCTFGEVDYGATHSLGRYLSMSLTSYVLPLVIVSVVGLKAVSMLCSGGLYLYKLMCVLYARARNSSLCVRLFGATIPSTTSSHVYTTPVKVRAFPTFTNTPSNTTVRTIGLQYDSRYVCAPSVLRIDSMHGVYGENLLCIEDATHATQTTTNTSEHPVNTTPTDLSPTVQSETSSESAQLKTRTMNMLVDGYAWDNGVETTATTDNRTNIVSANHTITTTILNTNHTIPDTTYSDTPISTDTSDTHSADVYAMYAAVVHSIENLSNNATRSSIDTNTTHTVPTLSTLHTKHTLSSVLSDYEQIDAPPVVHSNYDQNTTHTEEYVPAYDPEYDGEYADKYLNDSTEYTQDIVDALNTIYIHPSELDMSMESESGVRSVLYSSGNSPVSADSLAYSKSSTTSSNNNTTNACTTPNDQNTTLSTDTLPYTPYTLPTSTSVRTVDVYNNPAPLFKVPRVPSHYTDLNESPYETPVKCVVSSSGGNRRSGIKSSGGDAFNRVYDACDPSNGVFTTPTKNSTTTNNTSTTSTTSTTLIQSLLSPLSTPLHTNNTTLADSPDDDFKLRSNIKLKPLGMGDSSNYSGYGSNVGSSGICGTSSGVSISSRARSIYSSSVFSGDMHKHTTNTSNPTTNTANTIPESYYNVYSNPVSPEKGVITNATSDTSAPVLAYNTKRSSNIGKINNTTAISKSQTKKTNTTTTNTNNVNNNAQRWKGTLTPSLNLMR